METFNEYVKFQIFFNTSLNNDTTLKPIFSADKTTLHLDLESKYPSGIINRIRALRSLEVRANVTAIDDFVYPDSVLDGSTPKIKSGSDLLEAIWVQPRRELAVYSSVESTPGTRLRGLVALPNKRKSGAYYFENMLSILDASQDSVKLTPQEELYVALNSNTWGLLASQDELLVVATYEYFYQVAA